MPNIVVVLPDSLRADHLGCYGHPIATSPHIDAFSQSSYVFECCYAQSCWTKPSIASIYTGLLPRVHQAGIAEANFTKWGQTPIQVLKRQFVTLADSLRSAGYHTGLFLSNAVVQERFGFAQGFDHLRFVEAEHPTKLTGAVIDWIEKKAQPPFFIFMHGIEPHGPYTRLEMFHGLFGEEPARLLLRLPKQDQQLLKGFTSFYGHFAKEDRPERPALQKLSGEGFEYLQQLYDAEIALVDAEFGRLTQYLRDKGIFDRTVIALISDHGEAFNEHGYFTHRNTLYDEEIHVPLIIRPPGGLDTPRRIPYSVALFDLYSTVIKLGGGFMPPYVQSEPLLDAAGALAVGEDRRVFCDFDHDQADTERWDAAMVHGPHKVMSFSSAQPREYYDHITDPTEKKNLLSSGRRFGSTLGRLLKDFQEGMARHQELARLFGEPEWTEAGEEHIWQLKALGYL